jgi:DNA replication and repair protein RecF
MKKVHLEQINVQNYRNFSELLLDFTNGINIIIGLNGSGKTSILEAISLLSPGKGLKLANFNDVCKSGAGTWKTEFRLQSKLGKAEITTDFSTKNKLRKISYNGSKIASSELSNLLNVVWLTPQMEDLFLGSSSNRRRFLDRIVYNYDTRHAKALVKYEHFMRERNKILSQKDFMSQYSWLTTLEEKMAIEAKSIEYARQNAMNLMQESIDLLETPFPKAYLEISELFKEQGKIDGFIESYMHILKMNRQKDSYSSRTNFGVHKSDLLVSHKSQERLARICSTGEQKALLISVILASIEFILRNTQTTPIILLDELFVHLDDCKKKHLAEYITSSKLQTFITATDIIGIEQLAKNAHIIDL